MIEKNFISFFNCNHQATLKPETGGRDFKEKLQKGSVGNRGSKQKSSKTAQTWSVKQIVGGLVVVFFVTAVCVALLQRRDQMPSQTGVNYGQNYCFPYSSTH